MQDVPIFIKVIPTLTRHMFAAILSLTSLILCHNAMAIDTPVGDIIPIKDLDHTSGRFVTVNKEFNVTVLEPSTNAVEYRTEPKSGMAFEVAASVYSQESDILARRFVILAPDKELRPLARRIARQFGSIWAAASKRFGKSAQRLKRSVVQVWLTRTGEPGGEQSVSGITLYNVVTERTPIEWTREIAHEYGHYLLPSPSGFTKPESWANGVLGERYFLWAILEDSKSSPENELPFASLEDLKKYVERQSQPLFERFMRKGESEPALNARDESGMDAFCAFALYITRVYGDAVLFDLLTCLPANSSPGATTAAFLGAFRRLAESLDTLDLHFPGPGTYPVYVGDGNWIIESPKSLDRLATADGKLVLRGRTFKNAAGGWRMIRISGDDDLRMKLTRS